MPTLTRWFIKAALIYLVAALLIGVLSQARSLLNLPTIFGVLSPVYFHLLMVGWVTQLIIGVVYWMFPKYSKDRPRGSERLGWATFILLNTGLLLRGVAEPLLAVHTDTNLDWVLALSAVLQLLAGWIFILNTWPRIKER